MEKNSDSLLPYLRLEPPSDHPRFQRSSSPISRRSETPANKASTLQYKEISREIACPFVPMKSRPSQIPKVPLELDDIRQDMKHMKQRIITKYYSRVGCLFLCIFMPLTYNPLRCPHLPLREMKAFPGDLCPGNPHEGVLVFDPSEMPSMNTFDNIPMVRHR